MMRSLRRPAFITTVVWLAVANAVPTQAQVGGPPAPPVTLWQFLGIPQGVKKLQGATRNRRGNNPNLEPKPPMRAIADPRNLESPDPSIKKAAEVKQAEDLKRQKIKAVKYLASIGCGCYDKDGGVTAALAASMEDCTEDVRYETIKAVSEAAENGACARCGEGCCCNKEILTTLAKIAYERRDDGCYLEPSSRVREAAAEALVICCPNSSPPVIVEAQPAAPPEERETGGETIEGEESRESVPGAPGALPTPPTPPTADPSVQSQPPAGALSRVNPDAANRLVVPSNGGNTPDYGFGVVVHVSAPNGLAHIHFNESDMVAEEGSTVGVYAQAGQRRELLAKLQVVQSFRGSANVSGSSEDLSRISRGDVVLRAPVAAVAAPKTAVDSEWVSDFEEPPLQAVSHDEAEESATMPTGADVAQAAPATTRPPAATQLLKASTARHWQNTYIR